MTSALNSGIAQPRHPEIKTSSLAAARSREVMTIHIRNVDRYASIYRDDYDRVVAEIGTARWFVNVVRRAGGRIDHYVRARSPWSKNLVMVARIVARAMPKTAVRYGDGDTLNLRSDNLQVDLDGGNGGTKRRRRYGTGA